MTYEPGKLYDTEKGGVVEIRASLDNGLLFGPENSGAMWSSRTGAPASPSTKRTYGYLTTEATKEVP